MRTNLLRRQTLQIPPTLTSLRGSQRSTVSLLFFSLAFFHLAGFCHGVPKGSFMNCVSAVQACDFVFNNSITIVPAYPILDVKPPLPFTDSILYYNAKAQTTAPVIMGKLAKKCKTQKVKARKFGRDPACPPLNVSVSDGLKLAIQSTAPPPASYSNTCVLVQFDSLSIKMGPGRNNIAKLKSKDKNPLFPEKRRCAVFRFV